MELLLNLLKVSLVAGAAAALLTALKPILGRRYHAKWRYWVWLCLAALLLTVFMAASVISDPALAAGEGAAITDIRQLDGQAIGVMTGSSFDIQGHSRT